MCKSCTSGRSKAKVAGMKKSTSKLVKNGLVIAGGLIVGGLASKVSFIQANPILKVAAPLAGGFLVSKMMGAKGAQLAEGMVVLTVLQAVNTFVPAVGAQITSSLSGGVPFKSTYLPGVAGLGQTRQAGGVEVVMQ